MTRGDDFARMRLGGEDAVWNRIRYDRDGIIEASAGTGKTYALQSVVLKLATDAENPVDVKNILIVTYTDKAAGELKDRIRAVLAEAGRLPPDFDEMTICTIHSFCREILSEYAFENRVPMQMDVGGSNGDLIHRAVRAALLGDEFGKRHGRSYAVCMEAAGLSSTDRLAAEAEAALKECAAADRPPEAPPPVDAAFMERLGAAVSGADLGAGGVPVNGKARPGFEAACVAIAAEAANLSSGDMPTFVRAAMVCAAASKGLNPSVNGHGAGTRLFDLRPDLRELAGTLEIAGKAVAGQLVSDLASLAWPEFTRLKGEASLLTFDDLVTQAYRVIGREARNEAAGGRSALLDSIRRRYRIALVDEFQDTDEKQWTIFGSLFSSRANRMDGADAPAPKQGFLLVVGDPKQAIYGFRGADVATYLAAKREITCGEGAQPPQTLDATFRSSKPLVAAFNLMFGEESGWFSDNGGEDAGIGYRAVSYPEGNERFLALEDFTGRGAVTLLESLPRRLPDIASNRGSPGYGNMSTCLPVFMENAALEMERLHALDVAYRIKDPNAGKPVSRGIRYCDMCVLVRGGAAAETVKRVLASHGIPYSHYKERGLYASAEAEAMLAFFDFLSAPERPGNLAALLLTSLFNVHPSELEAWLAGGDTALSSLVGKWLDLSAKGDWNSLFESVMDDTALAHPAAGDYEYDRRWTACRQILDRLLAEKGRSAVAPGDFAALLRSWRKDDMRRGEDGSLRQRENEGDGVQIMTMHASKGLEFKAVFVASGFSGVDAGSIAEEKRLYYVALTRAEHKLYLPWTRWDSHLRKRSEERGLGSVGSPLLGEGFLSRAIRACLADAAEATVSLSAAALPAPASGHAAGQPPPAPRGVPRIYDVGPLKHLRLQWDSFSSLVRHGEPAAVAPATAGEADESPDGGSAAQSPLPTLLPRNNVSGNAFHEIMETLCGTDEASGGIGFSVGKVPLDEAVADSGPLMDLVRRTMRRNGLGGREADGDSTERTLARMAWRALNTCIEIGDRKMFLKDVPFADRLAEVEFVMDEASVLGEGAPHAGGIARDGAFNGKIDLLVRPDGRDGKVYVLDWKTNSLADYGGACVEAAMEAAGYPLQFKLYSLAVARWLGGDALAGVAYLFVRGGEHGAASGVYARPMDADALEDCRRSVLAAVRCADAGGGA